MKKMSRTPYRRQFDVHSPHIGEVNDMESMTIPDQEVSIAKMMIDQSRGLGGDFYRDGAYTRDHVVPQYFEDLTDLDRMRDDLERERAELNERIKSELVAKAKPVKRKSEAEQEPSADSEP